MDDLFAGSEAKCNQRRKLAAMRDGIEGAGVTLYPSGITGSEVWRDGQVLYDSGELPDSDREALAKINLSLTGKSGKTIAKDDVYIHYLEAANSNFIGDRFMFLDATTLRNVAERGESGMAFMNSHRTGGLSTPSELPFGRTFGGRYEELEHQGVIHRRALLGVYMLKGVHPNGTTGPSTDDLHKAIENGVLNDVSIGLNGGERICDVCARSLGDKDCSHTPGSIKGLSPEQMQAQTARGVKNGKASYTVVDGQPYEVSAVFKGAVPGAGFRKAMSLKAQARKDQAFGLELLSAYGSMMDDADRNAFTGAKTKMKFSDLLKLAGLAQSAGVQLEDLDEGDVSTLQSGTMVSVKATQMQTATSPDAEALNARKLELDARELELFTLRFSVEADQFVSPMVTDGKVTGPAIEALKLSFIQAALDDKFSPVTLSVGDKKLTRVEALKLSNAGRAKNILVGGDLVTDTPVVGEGLQILPSQESLKNGDEGPMSPERKAELLGLSQHGVAVLNGQAK